MSIMSNLLSIIIILGVCFSWGYTDGAAERESGKVDSHTIQFSSLFPSSSSCVLSSKASNTKSTLQVVHRHGACSPLRSEKAAKPDHEDILRLDQARVDSIHAKLSKNFTDRYRPSQSTELPAKDGITLGSGNYFVTFGIGTPKNDLSLVFDTGSDLTWTQCEPCVGSCYSQKEPIFNPSSSSSYSNVSCSSPDCASAACSRSTCIYGIRYGDGSSTLGFLAKERFTLMSDVFDGVTFGCGENNQGLFKGAAGLLGLGRGKLSFLSQATTYNNIFSYCLPSSPSFTGHLTFGSAGISNSVKYTPMTSVADASFYGLDIVGITVGDQKLDIPSTVFSTPGAIIDSGTVITRLPPKAYAALRDAFKEKMSNYTITSGGRIDSLLDTCYDFTGFETLTIPKISFSFGGGVVVDLELNGILYPIGAMKACLAFSGNENDGKAAIFGNVQQTRLQVVYDGVGGRIGFAPNGCS